MNDAIIVPCLEVQQPIGPFYIGRIESHDLVEIAFTDKRRIEANDIERVIGIQRELSAERVAEIKQYVKSMDASFPTSIIISISSDDAEFNDRAGHMVIARRQNVAKIIDGQHRIAGLEGYAGAPFQLNVTIFVDMEPEDQALLFATINLKQTKVNKSLAYDLFEYATKRSPQKTCHNIVKLLNAKEGSPFNRKIKILGRATGSSRETLTQAAFVDRLMPYISKDPLDDRNRIKIGKTLQRASSTEERIDFLIFRNMFIDDKDPEITRVLWNYFTAVAERWNDAWYERTPGNLLNRTVGFGALMFFLPHVYLHLSNIGDVTPTSKFRAVFDKIDINSDFFSREKLSLGASGEKELFKLLLQHAN